MCGSRRICHLEWRLSVIIRDFPSKFILFLILGRFFFHNKHNYLTDGGIFLIKFLKSNGENEALKWTIIQIKTWHRETFNIKYNLNLILLPWRMPEHRQWERSLDVCKVSSRIIAPVSKLHILTQCQKSKDVQVFYRPSSIPLPIFPYVLYFNQLYFPPKSSIFSPSGVECILPYYFQLLLNNLWNYSGSYLQYFGQASLHCNEVWFNMVIINAAKG